MPASLVGLRKRDCAVRAYLEQLKGLMVDFAQLANKQPPVAPQTLHRVSSGPKVVRSAPKLGTDLP